MIAVLCRWWSAPRKKLAAVAETLLSLNQVLSRSCRNWGKGMSTYLSRHNAGAARRTRRIYSITVGFPFRFAWDSWEESFAFISWQLVIFQFTGINIPRLEVYLLLPWVLFREFAHSSLLILKTSLGPNFLKRKIWPKKMIFAVHGVSQKTHLSFWSTTTARNDSIASPARRQF